MTSTVHSESLVDQDARVTRWPNRMWRSIPYVLDAHLAVTADFDPADLVDRALEVHASLNQDPPGLLGFLLSTPGVTRSPGVAEAINDRIVVLLRCGAPDLSDDRRTVAAGMIMNITNRLYALGRPAGAAVRAEVRHALLSYITTLV